MTIAAFEAIQPKLDHLLDMHVDLEPPQLVGATPCGTRQIFIVKTGTFDGPNLKGEVLPGGGDWATARSDGCIQLDVRATLRTDDGALIYTYYTGIIGDAMKTAGRVFGGEDVPLGEYYFYTNPMFQTSAEQYEWLNGTVCLGRGRIVPGGVEYRLWAVTNPS
jgi:hypothetical protein